MNRAQALEIPILRKMLEKLAQGLGPRLQSVVLYGSAARGEFHEETSDLNLLLVLGDLEPETLEALGPVAAWWRKQGHHPPRLFSRESLAQETDVFPIEFLDLRDNRVVLAGDDLFANLTVRQRHLRLQCERELREKMMRLREGYLEAHGSRPALRRLLTGSYSTFVALFRGCLHLLGAPVPARNADAAAAFCARAGLDPGPFRTIDGLRRGERGEDDLKTLFSRYYGELTKAVGAVDRFQPTEGGVAR